jgi:hypothetical protein
LLNRNKMSVSHLKFNFPGSWARNPRARGGTTTRLVGFRNPTRIATAVEIRIRISNEMSDMRIRIEFRERTPATL